MSRSEKTLLIGTRLLYTLILFGMGVNGALYLSWFLSRSSPDGIGFWFLIYFLVFPYLGSLGIMALLLKKALNIPWGIGTLLLLYVGILTLLANSYQLGFNWILSILSSMAYVHWHVTLFIFTLVRLIILMQRR